MILKEYGADENKCPGCGAQESDWAGYESKGFIGSDGDIYCCQACSEGRVCNCNPERVEALVKRRAI